MVILNHWIELKITAQCLQGCTDAHLLGVNVDLFYFNVNNITVNKVQYIHKSQTECRVNFINIYFNNYVYYGG